MFILLSEFETDGGYKERGEKTINFTFGDTLQFNFIKLKMRLFKHIEKKGKYIICGNIRPKVREKIKQDTNWRIVRYLKKNTTFKKNKIYF